MNVDVASELLIAELLKEDVMLLESLAKAEAFQLDQAFEDTRPPGEMEVERESVSPESPADVYQLQMTITEIENTADFALAETLQGRFDAQITGDYQAALRFAAEERRGQIDFAFAQKLQKMQTETRADISSKDFHNVDDVLGKDAVDSIMAGDPNCKGKGKGKAPSASASNADAQELCIVSEPPNVHICGICLEPVTKTVNPLLTARTPTSSSRLMFGVGLPCPGGHVYCLDCVISYIRSQLEEGGSHQTVFPIRCPECPPQDYCIDDAFASRVLEGDLLDLWHFRRLLESLPKFYCPNSRCSALLELNEGDTEPQAICPHCHTLMCKPCQSVWHSELTCEEYQNLPEDERTPEDRQVLELARAQSWRRCPSCHVIVELTQGCNHITCNCRHEFCHRCGSDWKGKCTMKPPCQLWDEEMLFEEQERRRRGDRQPLPPRAPPGPHALQHVGEAIAHPAMGWMEQEGAVNTGHSFTGRMVNNLTCGYCYVRVNSFAELRHHLTHNGHRVYACCGKFFYLEEDYNRHHQMGRRHRSTYVRNA